MMYALVIVPTLIIVMGMVALVFGVFMLIAYILGVIYDTVQSNPLGWLALAVAAVLLFVATGCSGSAYLYAGIDYAGSGNPICGDTENGNHYGDNDALTSNMGVKYVIPVSKLVNITTQYTHHSCVHNDDATLYDAVGIIGEVKLW
jgi:hypothetical protein